MERGCQGPEEERKDWRGRNVWRFHGTERRPGSSDRELLLARADGTLFLKGLAFQVLTSFGAHCLGQGLGGFPLGAAST